MLVAAELMRRGIEVAHPASDRGVDLLAYRLTQKETVPGKFVPVQVKSRSGTGFNFQKGWFDKVPGLVLVHVWNIQACPEFYIFDSVARVEEALGPTYASSPSWENAHVYTVTTVTDDILKRMKRHKDKWERIVNQL